VIRPPGQSAVARYVFLRSAPASCCGTHCRLLGSHCAHQPSNSARVIFASATALEVPSPDVPVIEGLGHLPQTDSQSNLCAPAVAAAPSAATATATRDQRRVSMVRS
jgi:predicted naringenin-chalcone synthase